MTAGRVPPSEKSPFFSTSYRIYVSYDSSDSFYGRPGLLWQIWFVKNRLLHYGCLPDNDESSDVLVIGYWSFKYT